MSKRWPRKSHPNGSALERTYCEIEHTREASLEAEKACLDGPLTKHIPVTIF
jgi:hypothetical protein